MAVGVIIIQRIKRRRIFCAVRPTRRIPGGIVGGEAGVGAVDPPTLMIAHDVEHHIHAARMRRRHHAAQFIHRAEVRRKLIKIMGIVSVIGGIAHVEMNRLDPNRIGPKRFDVIEFPLNPLEVAAMDTVAGRRHVIRAGMRGVVRRIAVKKAIGEDLIDVDVTPIGRRGKPGRRGVQHGIPVRLGAGDRLLVGFLRSTILGEQIGRQKIRVIDAHIIFHRVARLKQSGGNDARVVFVVARCAVKRHRGRRPHRAGHVFVIHRAAAQRLITRRPAALKLVPAKNRHRGIRINHGERRAHRVLPDRFIFAGNMPGVADARTKSRVGGNRHTINTRAIFAHPQLNHIGSGGSDVQRRDRTSSHPVGPHPLIIIRPVESGRSVCRAI